jgi:flagellar basal body-associated protein FliL
MSYIFIAHVEEDAEIALEIALGLEKAGYRTWCYEVDSVPGPSYLVRTGEAVAQSQAMVIVISPHSLGSSQVTKEVVRAHESAKHFIPILRDITHAEFQKRQPEWREAIGSATSIRIPSEGVTAILPLITDGLKSLGIQPGAKVDAARIGRISSTLEEIKGHPPSQEGKAATVKPIEEHKKARSRKLLIIIAASLIVIAIVVVAVIFLGRGGGTGNGESIDGLTPTNVFKPDLVIQDITWSPQNPSMGNDVSFTITITNQGKDKAGASHVAYYIDSAFQDTISVNEIDSGETGKLSFKWKAELGTHKIKAVADFNDSVAESDETNNEKEIAFSNTTAADLIVSDITWSPANPAAGESVTFTITVMNQGNGAAVSGFYTSWDIGGIDYYNNGGEYYNYNELYPGHTETGGFVFQFKRGTNIIHVFLDRDHRVPESDETNNSKTVTLVVP